IDLHDDALRAGAGGEQQRVPDLRGELARRADAGRGYDDRRVRPRRRGQHRHGEEGECEQAVHGRTRPQFVPASRAMSATPLRQRLPQPLRRVLARTRDVPLLTRPGRSGRFRSAPHDRFWWHRLRSTGYVPPLYGSLSRREWAVVEGWFAETGRRGG